MLATSNGAWLGKDTPVADTPADVDAFIESLTTIVGSEHVLTDPDVVAPFAIDWTRRFVGPCLAVVRPGSTEAVAAVLRACHAHGIPVIPQGGNTGVVGGGVPWPAGDASADERGLPVIVSMIRMAWIDEVDALSGQVSVGAGTTLGDLQREVRKSGWEYGVDLAARDSATVGGTVATNAGGIHVIAHGMTRAQVVGLEAVLADGSIVRQMSGLLKDNTGYDLAALLCGSEGTLGVITAVRVRLQRPPRRTSLALIGVGSVDEALSQMAGARQRGPVRAAEAMDANSVDLVCAATGLRWPLARRHEFVVLLEVEDGGDATGLPLTEDDDAVVGLDAAEQGRLWAYRERLTEAYAGLGIVHKIDVAVPLAAMAAFEADLRARIAGDPQVTRFGVFGHLADGNLHVQIVGPPAEDERLDLIALECAASFGGSISAEHGIGRAKVDHLTMSKSPSTIEAMRAIKGALDPTGILNPGVLLR